MWRRPPGRRNCVEQASTGAPSPTVGHPRVEVSPAGRVVAAARPHLGHLGLPTELPPLNRTRGALSANRRATPRPALAPPLPKAAARYDSNWDLPVYAPAP